MQSTDASSLSVTYHNTPPYPRATVDDALCMVLEQARPLEAVKVRTDTYLTLTMP